tara:strand:+ start:720 stop:1634 length:915 start_codon:yes stop_codon:yes gene_type:complete
MYTTEQLNRLALPPELDFDPVLRPIEHEGTALPPTIGQKIVRADTNDVLGIVKSRYTPQPYSALWEPLIDGLCASELDLSEATATFRSVRDGAAMLADITLKNYNYDKIVGEPTALALRVRNSVDGTTKYEVSARILRLACLNGMTRVSESTSARFMHTAGTDPERIGKVASEWPLALEQDAHLFNHMRQVPVSVETAQTFLAKNLCFTRTRTKVKTNEKWLNRMMATHDSYRASIGDNGYAFYNTLTHYGTHVDTDSGRQTTDVGQRALQQERNVTALVRGPAFKNLVEYDVFERQFSSSLAA